MADFMFQQYGNVFVITLIGSLNINNTSEAKSFFLDNASKNPTAIALNCKDLSRIDSSGLGLFLNFAKIAKEKGFELIICEPNNHVMNLFDISKLDKYFTIMTWEDFKAQYA